jgi:hypothetical protein
MKRTELQARRAWPAVRWAIFVVLVGIFASASAQETAVLTVESVTVPPAAKTTISVTVENVPAPGIASIQGQFSYDPKVLTVTDVTFPQITGGSSVTVFNNLKDQGIVRFAATLAGADIVGITEGTILEFSVEAVGKNGDKSNLTLTVQILSDVEYNAVPYQIVNGVFEIKEVVNQPPVADFEFSPDTAGRRTDRQVHRQIQRPRRPSQVLAVGLRRRHDEHRAESVARLPHGGDVYRQTDRDRRQGRAEPARREEDHGGPAGADRRDDHELPQPR